MKPGKCCWIFLGNVRFYVVRSFIWFSYLALAAWQVQTSTLGVTPAVFAQVGDKVHCPAIGEHKRPTPGRQAPDMPQLHDPRFGVVSNTNYFGCGTTTWKEKTTCLKNDGCERKKKDFVNRVVDVLKVEDFLLMAQNYFHYYCYVERRAFFLKFWYQSTHLVNTYRFVHLQGNFYSLKRILHLYHNF